jgi:hypothetical protein
MRCFADAKEIDNKISQKLNTSEFSNFKAFFNSKLEKLEFEFSRIELNSACKNDIKLLTEQLDSQFRAIKEKSSKSIDEIDD